jgi:hypothetical protein
MTMLQSYAIVMSFVVGTLIAALAYLRRVDAGRPPVGVFNNSDVATMLVGIVVLPFVYLAIPSSVAIPVFGLVMVAIIAMALGPIVRRRGVPTLIAGALAAADFDLDVVAGSESPALRVANGVLLALAVVGVANLWVQSGMRTRHLLVVTVALTAYDTLATAWSPLTFNLFNHLATGPFAPFLVWRAGGRGLTVGLGDLLIATIFVILVDKSYGPRAATVALVSTAAALGVFSALAVTDTLPGFTPGMWALAPVIILHIAYLSRSRGPERTFAQYRAAAPATR